LTHVHLIGISGSGLSAIARILLEKGYKVSGSDRKLTPLSLSLVDAGALLFEGHLSENIKGADIVVRSSAIPENNPELIAAHDADIPVLKRSEFLKQLLDGKKCIAVAGTHGKTTTTAMIAWILSESGWDPSYIIGGISSNLGGNAHAGDGEYFVIEADEYDRMFLGLDPYIAVVTNIEHDHPDCYPTPQEYESVFRQFVFQIQKGGLLVACADNPGALNLSSEAASRGLRTKTYQLTRDHQFSLQVPGDHNRLNALAAIAVGEEVGISKKAAIESLEKFDGVGRRFELRGEVDGVTVIDDYAHHPSEIRATLNAAHERYPDRQVWSVWQPHTYSRTRQLLPDYARAFSRSDYVIVTDIFAAREISPEDKFSSRDVAGAITAQKTDPGHVLYIPTLDQVEKYLLDHLSLDDVLLILSAGDADLLSSNLLISLAERKKR